MNFRPFVTSISCKEAVVGFKVFPSLDEAHQLKSICLRVLSRVAEDITILHPWRNHTELV
jgi:hypothetical protein